MLLMRGPAQTHELFCGASGLQKEPGIPEPKNFFLLKWFIDYVGGAGGKRQQMVINRDMLSTPQDTGCSKSTKKEWETG